MGLLLDTHAALWWLADATALPREAKAAIVGAVNGEGVLVSSVSVLEVAEKSGRRQMPPAATFVADMEASGFRLLAFDAQDAIAVEDLPRIHSDPLDRAIAAQAQRRQLTLMTSDQRLAQYPIAIYRL